MPEDQNQTEHAADPAVETLQQERDAYLAGWKRAQADYANLQRETEKAKQSFTAYATEECLMKLLPALDQFEIALQFQPSLDAVPEEKRRPFETWITGLHAVRSLWEQAAQGMGLAPVPTAGPLDPQLQEAVSEESHPTILAGNIIRVTQPGWTLNGRLLRPAKVILSTGSEHAAEAPSGSDPSLTPNA